jgi:acyl-CoA synthetase (AMP-forming)/AMP-acid ligase II
VEADDRLTVPALIRRWSSDQPEKPFVVADDGVLTYGELDHATTTIATHLTRDGIVKGTRVGVLMPNSVAWVLAALAASRIGAVVVPLSTLLRPPELEAQLRTAAVEHLFLVREFRGRRYVDDLAEISPALTPGADLLFDRTLPRLRSVHVWDEWRARDADSRGAVIMGTVDALERSVRPADDLAIIFTSGSRGTPKGVIHTHAGALAATAAGLDGRCLTRDDRLYIPMPFFWVGGFGTGLLSTLVAGATLVSEAQPEPSGTLRLLEREQVTLFRGWPGQADALASHPAFPTADLRALRPGSLEGLLPPTDEPRRRASLLGMTETFGPYCGERLDRDLPPDKAGSCGHPFPGVELRIVDPDTHAPLDAGTVGEIHVRSRNLMRGICGRLRAEIFTVDGFLPTGDLGVVDDDGYLFFRGRRDDMFKVKGASVYPSEVEVALQSIPTVERAFAVPVEVDGAVAVGAVVVRAPGTACTEGELVREARARLSAYKVPARWAVVDAASVPTMATGKVDTAALRRLLTEGS